MSVFVLLAGDQVCSTPTRSTVKLSLRLCKLDLVLLGSLPRSLFRACTHASNKYCVGAAVQMQGKVNRSVSEINGRIYKLMATVGISTMIAFQANPTAARTIVLQQHFGQFQDFVKVQRPKRCAWLPN